MKSFWICAFLILSSLGTSSASGDSSKKGVHVVDDRAQDSFRHKHIIDANLSHRNAVIEIDLTSVEMLVTLTVDTTNMKAVTTILQLHGDVPHETKQPPKDKDDLDNVGANHSQGSSDGKCSFPFNNRSTKQIIPREILPTNNNCWMAKSWNALYDNNPSWMDKPSNALYDVIISLFGWIELPKDINSNMFNWRSATMSTVDSTCPRDGSVNHSMSNVDSTDITEQKYPTNMSSASQRKENDNSMSNDKQNITATLKTNESSQRMDHDPSVSLNEDDDRFWLPEKIPPELLPKFKMTSSESDDEAEYSNLLTNEKFSPENVKNVTNNQDNITTNCNVPREPAASARLIEENPSTEDDGALRLRKSHNITRKDKENGSSSLMVNDTSSFTASTGNYDDNTLENTGNEVDNVSHGNMSPGNTPNVTHEELTCPNHPADDGHWMKEVDKGVCLKDHDNVSLEIGDKTLLIDLTTRGNVLFHIPRVRKTKDDWIEESLTGHKFEMCPLRSKKPGLELEQCTNNVTISSSDGSWYSPVSVASTKSWYKCKAGIQAMWLYSKQTRERIRDMANYFWRPFQIRMTIWTWQDTFDVMIICWMINYCAITFYIILPFVKEIIRVIRLQRECERERLRQLELERERAAQPKKWQPKPKKKRRKKHDDW
ncbi:hypothetical protein OS493_026805 [Desmophyllum pertusum]|uniref:Uncharacterized protein n=1 Tax=Desmophyllum pertusum TaxID=174260 RepID=A0A9W9ZPJ5_9CNID|nr:hypothetical protein OS493_026805 [Desmophyllum pertusum]